MSCELEPTHPNGVLYRLGRQPDPWAWLPGVEYRPARRVLRVEARSAAVTSDRINHQASASASSRKSWTASNPPLRVSVGGSVEKSSSGGIPLLAHIARNA
jgi:hypothetical protein